jgi:O-antigen/teichoic acid export membrane protein
MTKRVRLRYSGFVMFLSRVISVGTGIIFILIITRNISAEEFGLFGNLGDTLSYFTLVAGIVPFWTTRFSARRHLGTTKTGLLANFILSAIFSVLYLSLLSTIMSMLGIGEAYRIVYMVLFFQIIETYILSELEAILLAEQPHSMGYGYLIYEVSKVTAGFFFIIELKLGLLGAVSSIIFAYAVQIVYYLKLASHSFSDEIKWDYIKEWIKASPINFYSAIGLRLMSLVLILLFVYGGELARAYYGAALTIATVISYSSFLAYALYPRLLSEISLEDVTTSLRMVLMFTIPMTVGAITLSDSYLTILNPLYLDAKLILILLSLNNACSNLTSIFTSIVLGSEQLDVEAKIVFKDLIKSGLFLVYSLPYIQSALMLPIAYFTLATMVKSGIEAATIISLVTLISNIIILFILYVIAKKYMKFGLPWDSITKYILASAVMAIALYLFPSPTRLTTTLALTLLGVIIYFVILFFIDKETKAIFTSAKNHLEASLSRNRSLI